MERDTILEKLREVIRPYLDEPELLGTATEKTKLVDELHINSMHMIDIIIELEDAFDFEITDTDHDRLVRIGDVVDLVQERTGTQLGCTQGARES